MKRVIFSTILFFGFTAFASAQTATRTTKTTRTVSTTTKGKKSKQALKPSDTLNNRKTYHFKNGQRATPTGAEATASGVGGGYAALGRSKAPAVRKDTAKALTRKAAITKSNKEARRNNR